jgi:sRNA-binding protein
MFDMQNNANSKGLLAVLAAITSLSLAAEPVLNDPTRPYKTDVFEQRNTQPTSRYNLNSTLVSNNRRVAVINGIYVTEGETVADATVISIRKHDVTLQSSNRLITLKLLPDIIKRHPRTVEIQP